MRNVQQILHLLVVDCERRAALAAWFGSRWLLPIVRCGERTRGALAAQRWTASRGLQCDVAGQWLGRIGAHATDWLVVMRATSGCANEEPPLCWRSLYSLSSSAALVDYQRWAISRSVQPSTLPLVPGSFGNVDWIDQVSEWIRGSTDEISALSPLRLTAHEVVVAADTRCGRVFFKGLARERACEAHLTRALHALCPDSFARTIALRTLPDGSVWWLTAECPGTMTRDTQAIGAALARLQGRLIDAETVRGVTSRLDLDECGRWASQLLEANTADILIDHIARVTAAPVPESWSPLDLHPTNVLVNPGAVRFIDVDGSFLAPAPLAAGVFANRCGDRSLYRMYEQAWLPRLTGIDWRAFEVTAAAVDAWLAWRRFESRIGSGELSGASGLAASRTRERLERAVHRL